MVDVIGQGFQNSARPAMEIRITEETTFEDGNTQTCDIGRLCRAPDKLGPGSLGLHLAEAENLLKLLQEAVLQG